MNSGVFSYDHHFYSSHGLGPNDNVTKQIIQDITVVSITVTEDHINKDIKEEARSKKMKEQI